MLGENYLITEIKYFTARISGRDGNNDSPLRQKAYLLALEKYLPEVKIYYGHYLTHQVMARICTPINGQTPYVKVFKTEEKGSDVNLALHILNDAWLDKYDCAVLVSNDSDIAEALRLIKTDHNKNIGVITPGNIKLRRPSRELIKYANFRREIREGVLSSSQLPNPIPGTKIFKPVTW